MIIRDVANLIAGHIGKSYPNDREDIFETIDLVQNEIWKSGLFHGSTKWAYVNVRNDNTIITPHGYDVLLGLNIDFKPRIIRDTHFLFHQNGPADAALLGNGFNKNVQYLGEFPVIGNPEKLCDPCNKGVSCEYFYVGARVSGACNTFPKTRIYGTSPNGKNIYSYVSPTTNETCLCEDEEDIEIWDAIEGVELSLTNILKVSKIKFASITGITKEPSSSVVEYYKLDEKGNGEMIASLDPFQIKSKYKAYLVPKSCIKNRCVFGLFKKSKPENTIHESQVFLTDNKSAIISMAKSFDFKYNKNDIERAIAFEADAKRSLSDEVKEETPNVVSPIQVVGPIITQSKF